MYMSDEDYFAHEKYAHTNEAYSYLRTPLKRKINESKTKRAITKQQYDKIKAEHVAASKGYGPHANTLHVYKDDNGVVWNQTWAHKDHNLPSIETDGKSWIIYS